MTEPPPPALDRRRITLGVVVALIVGVLLVASIGRLAGFGEVTATLGGAHWQWLPICAAGQVVVFFGWAGTFRRTVAFEEGPEIPPGVALRVALASFGLTQLLAAGGVAGLAFTYWAIRRLGFDTRAAAVRLIALNAAVYLIFGLVAGVGAAVASANGAVPLGMTVPWLVGFPLVLMSARWFTAAHRVEAWSESAGGRLRRALATGVSAAWWVRRATADRRGRAVLAWAALYWIGDVASLWASLRAFGGSIGLFPLVAAYTTGYLAQAIPIPFVATGGVDAATTFTLTAVGVPMEVALLGVVAHRVFAFWLPIGPGPWFAARLARAGHGPQT